MERKVARYEVYWMVFRYSLSRTNGRVLRFSMRGRALLLLGMRFRIVRDIFLLILGSSRGRGI